MGSILKSTTNLTPSVLLFLLIVSVSFVLLSLLSDDDAVASLNIEESLLARRVAINSILSLLRSSLRFTHLRFNSISNAPPFNFTNSSSRCLWLSEFDLSSLFSESCMTTSPSSKLAPSPLVKCNKSSLHNSLRISFLFFSLFSSSLSAGQVTCILNSPKLLAIQQHLISSMNEHPPFLIALNPSHS